MAIHPYPSGQNQKRKKKFENFLKQFRLLSEKRKGIHQLTTSIRLRLFPKASTQIILSLRFRKTSDTRNVAQNRSQKKSKKKNRTNPPVLFFISQLMFPRPLPHTHHPKLPQNLLPLFRFNKRIANRIMNFSFPRAMRPQNLV